MSAGTIRAGKADVEIGANNGPLQRGLAKAAAMFRGFKSQVGEAGASLGSLIAPALSAITAGAKVAGLAVAGIGAGLLAAAKIFSGTDKRLLSDEESAAADALGQSLSGLIQSAQRANAALMTQLQPALSAVIDIVRIGMQAFSDWIATQKDLLSSVGDFIAGVRDALTAGDIQLAGEILWQGLKIVWKTGINALMDAVMEWKIAFEQTISEAFLGVQKLADNLWNAITDGAQYAADFMVDAFRAALAGVMRVMAYVGEKIGVLEKGANRIIAESYAQSKEKRQEQRNVRNEETAKNRAKAEEEFGQTVLDANKAIADANKAEMDAARRDLDNAKESLQGMLARAKDAAKNEAKVKLPEVLDLKKQQEKTTVTGSFSAAALRGVADNPMKKVEENTKRQVDLQTEQRDILRDIRDNGGLAYA